MNTQDLETILEEETHLMWSTIEDKPTLKRFTAISLEIRVSYMTEDDYWRFSFDDAVHNGDSCAIGPIDTEDVTEEFRSFVKELDSDGSL